MYGRDRIAGVEADLRAGAEDLTVQNEADVCGKDVVVSVEVDVLHAAKKHVTEIKGNGSRDRTLIGSFRQFSPQCCGSGDGSVCFWATRMTYGSGSDSGYFYHQGKIVRKIIIPTFL